MENKDSQKCPATPDASQMKEKEKELQELLKMRLSKIKHKIMVMSGKGGVGKTTVTINIASMLNSLGYKVGILDADIHGPNIPKMLGIRDKGMLSSSEGIEPFEGAKNLKVVSVAFLLKSDDDAVIWRGPLKHSLIQQFLSEVNWGELDFLLIDLPPGTGDEPLSVIQTLDNVDGSVVVTTPQEVALLDSRKSVTFSKKIGSNVLGIVENMSGFVCPECGCEINLFKKGGGKKAAEELDVDFLGQIPIEKKVVDAGDEGIPFVAQFPDLPTSRAFKGIVEKIIEKVS